MRIVEQLTGGRKFKIFIDVDLLNEHHIMYLEKERR